MPIWKISHYHVKVHLIIAHPVKLSSCKYIISVLAAPDRDGSGAPVTGADGSVD